MNMCLHIAPNRFISDIQQEFNKIFPFLKLEFFSKSALARSDYSASQLIRSNKKIGDLQAVVTDGYINLEGEMKVIELEDRLKNEFSLGTQVFRKSGNLWLETTMTDNWTLHQQNNHGREISTEKNTVQRTRDYDLDRDADH